MFFLTEQKTQAGYHILKPCSSDPFALSQSIYWFQKLDKLKFIFCNVFGHFCTTNEFVEKTKKYSRNLKKILTRLNQFPQTPLCTQSIYITAKQNLSANRTPHITRHKSYLMFNTQYIYVILVTTSASKHHKDNKKKKWSVFLFKTCLLWKWQLFLPCKWQRVENFCLSQPLQHHFTRVCLLIVVTQRNAQGRCYW